MAAPHRMTSSVQQGQSAPSSFSQPVIEPQGVCLKLDKALHLPPGSFQAAGQPSKAHLGCLAAASALHSEISTRRAHSAGYHKTCQYADTQRASTHTVFPIMLQLQMIRVWVMNLCSEIIQFNTVFLCEFYRRNLSVLELFLCAGVDLSVVFPRKHFIMNRSSVNN